MRKQIKKRISIMVVLSMMAGSFLSMLPDADAQAEKIIEEPPIVVIGDDPSASPTPLPTLSPEEEVLRKRAADAMEMTKSKPILGCRAPIGTGDNGRITIFSDIVQDFISQVRREREYRVDKDDNIEWQAETWFDIIGKNYYAYDKKRGMYLYEPGGEDYSKLDYLSLDFYLDYVPTTGSFTSADPVEVDLYDGHSVKCDVIKHAHVVSQEMPTINGSGRYIYYNYYIGQEDGLIYKIEHFSGSIESMFEMAHVFYYPTKSLSIPKEYTDNPILADGVALLRNNFWYLSYSKGKKTYLSAYEYEKKKAKKITLKSSIKLGKRTYTVNSIDRKAFFGMEKLEKVTIPKTITSIGKDAFSGCPNLETLIVKNKTLRNKIKKNKSYRKKIGYEGGKVKG